MMRGLAESGCSSCRGERQGEGWGGGEDGRVGEQGQAANSVQEPGGPAGGCQMAPGATPYRRLEIFMGRSKRSNMASTWRKKTAQVYQCLILIPTWQFSRAFQGSLISLTHLPRPTGSF